jgi:uncharacterized damage-inducible protein DinB
MHAKLQKQFTRLEDDRKEMFGDLKQYSDELLNKKPGADAWSVAEVLTHVLTAEEYSLKYLQKKVLSKATVGTEGFKQKYRWLLVKTVFTFNIKFKAPEVVVPKIEFTTLADLDARWTALRSDMYKLLDNLDDADADKILWKHALAGNMSLHHMVEFLGMHYHRHKKQVSRTLVAVK